MSWKEWSYRKKGGIIGFSLGVIIYLFISYTFGKLVCLAEIKGVRVEDLSKAVETSRLVCSSFPKIVEFMVPNSIPEIIAVIGLLGATFAIGAGIGWLIGKRKEEK